jgi:hypothetical protein
MLDSCVEDQSKAMLKQPIKLIDSSKSQAEKEGKIVAGR